MEETKKCPYCAETIKAEAIVCRFCGRDLSKPTPASVPYSAPSKKKSPIITLGIFAAVIFVLCCGVFLVSAILSGGSSQNNKATNSQPSDTASGSADSAEATSPTSTPQVLAPSIEEILSTVDGMTDVQRNQYMESLKDNRIEGWTGIVTEVNEGEILGGYVIYVDAVPDNFGDEVFIDVSKEVALSINKGQTIEFSGTIDYVSDLLGTTVRVKDATISINK